MIAVVTELEDSTSLIPKPAIGHDPEPVPPTSHSHNLFQTLDIPSTDFSCLWNLITHIWMFPASNLDQVTWAALIPRVKSQLAILVLRLHEVPYSLKHVACVTL